MMSKNIFWESLENAPETTSSLSQKKIPKFPKIADFLRNFFLEDVREHLSARGTKLSVSNILYVAKILPKNFLVLTHKRHRKKSKIFEECASCVQILQTL